MLALLTLGGLLAACGKSAEVPLHVVFPESGVQPDVFTGQLIINGVPTPVLPQVKSVLLSVATGTPGGSDMVILGTQVQDVTYLPAPAPAPPGTLALKPLSLAVTGLQGGTDRYVVLEGLADSAGRVVIQLKNKEQLHVLARGISTPQDYLAPGQTQPTGKKYPPVGLFFGRVGYFEPLPSQLSNARAFFGTANLGNGKIAFAGGVGFNAAQTGFAPLDSVEVFDGTVFGFQQQPTPMTAARAFSSAVPIPSGGALVVGGTSDFTSANNTDDILNADGIPTGQAPPVFPSVFSAGAPFDNNGQILVVVAGGNAGSVGVTEPTDNLEELLGGALEVGTLLPMTAKRAAFTATELAGGQVLFAGGYADVPDGLNDLKGPTATAELLDFTGTNPNGNNSFLISNQMSAPRWGHTATLLDDGTVLLVGGATQAPNPTTGRSPVTGSIDLFVPSVPPVPSNAGIFRLFPWTPVSSTSSSFAGGGGTTPVAHHAAVKLNSGDVLITGGATTAGSWSAGSGSQFLATNCASVYRYAASGAYAPAFLAAQPMNVPRYGHATVPLGGGQILVVGGYNLTGEPQASAEIYTPCWNDQECQLLFGTPAPPPAACPSSP